MKVSGPVHVQQEHEVGGITQEQQEVDGNLDVEGGNDAATEDWDPLRNPLKELSAERSARTPEMVQIEDDIVVQSLGQEVLVGDEKGNGVLRVQSPTTATARRASHLHLDLKSALPSSQPWDTDGPLQSITQTKLEYPETGSAVQPKFPPCVVHPSFISTYPSNRYIEAEVMGLRLGTRGR